MSIWSSKLRRFCGVAMLLPAMVAALALDARGADSVTETINLARRLNEEDKADVAAALLEAAIDTWREQTEKHPDDHAAFGQLARLLTEYAQDEEALKAIDRAIALAPAVAVYHRTRSELLDYADKPEESLAELKRAVELAPDDVELLELLGERYLDSGKAELAEETFRKTIKLDPKRDTAVANLARALVGQGRQPEAFELLKPLLERETKDVIALETAGLVMASAGELQKARDYWLRALQIEPEDEALLSRMVVLSEGLKQLGDRERYRTALLKLHREGKTAGDSFERDEFVVGDHWVQAFEYYELAGETAVRYLFEVSDTEKGNYQISLGSYELANRLARESGKIKPDERVFHLDMYQGNAHASLGSYTAEPNYEAVRKLVMDTIAGKQTTGAGKSATEAKGTDEAKPVDAATPAIESKPADDAKSAPDAKPVADSQDD